MQFPFYALRNMLKHQARRTNSKKNTNTIKIEKTT